MNDVLFRTTDTMRNCVVKMKKGKSTSFELYDECTDRFLLSCVFSLNLSPMLLLVTLQDAHQRHFDEICCNLSLRQYVAKMVPDWMTGCNFKLTKFQGTEVCEIK